MKPSSRSSWIAKTVGACQGQLPPSLTRPRKRSQVPVSEEIKQARHRIQQYLQHWHDLVTFSGPKKEMSNMTLAVLALT